MQIETHISAVAGEYNLMDSQVSEALAYALMCGAPRSEGDELEVVIERGALSLYRDSLPLPLEDYPTTNIRTVRATLRRELRKAQAHDG